jgi:ethanolamine utilization cobalamin adenosyltransferase
MSRSVRFNNAMYALQRLKLFHTEREILWRLAADEQQQIYKATLDTAVASVVEAYTVTADEHLTLLTDLKRVMDFIESMRGYSMYSVQRDDVPATDIQRDRKNHQAEPTQLQRRSDIERRAGEQDDGQDHQD